MENEELLRTLHTSLCIRFGTDAPFAIGTVSAERIGYADIKSVVVTVCCRPEDISTLVPIVRQRVYGELAERGWSAEDVAFTPSTQLRSHRKRRFRDANESSPSYGQNKMGHEVRFAFEMSRELAQATFNPPALKPGGYRPYVGTYAKLPERS